jgi:ABC-type sugar transport system ATPase subunit
VTGHNNPNPAAIGGPVSEPGPPLLRVEGIHKWFGGVHALDDVAFEVRAGETVGLVGDNGAGKSTLLKILSGVQQPSQGQIYVADALAKIASPAAARELGIETVYQDLALIGRFTIAENFFLGRELEHRGALRPFRLLHKRAMTKAADEALARLHIEVPGAGRPVARMSGGQRQAVAISRGAFWGRSMLLLDEPTAALGVREAGAVLRLLRELHTKRLATVLVTHNLDHLWEVCTRVVVLRRGRKVADVAVDATTPSDVVASITGAAAGAAERI